MGTGKLLVRALVLLAAAWVVWRVAYAVGGGAGRTPLHHLSTGILVTLPMLGVLALLLRFDRLRWSTLGMAPGRGAGLAFAAGFLLWLVPATLATATLLLLGWVRIEPVSGIGEVLLTLSWLLPAVLLVEALPEELAFRGYLQGLASRALAPWLAVLLQAIIFTCFAWAIGALYSPGQWMFIPGYGVIMGVVRALYGSPWTSMGMHAAWMTTTQLLLAQGHFQVADAMTLLFLAFTLAPAVVAGVVLDRRRGGFDWSRPEGSMGAG